MKNRKKHVMKKAHELFCEKGFQATSIQEILEKSEISKGTFYNYFSSKNELLITILRSIYITIDHQRKELLIGRDREDVSIFIQQIDLLIEMNDQYKVIALLEEIFFTNDEELKGYIRWRRIQELSWVYHRLLDICHEEKKMYLVDGAIMLTGIIQTNLSFQAYEKQTEMEIHKIVRYSVNRVLDMINNLAKTKEVIVSPDQLLTWVAGDSETISQSDTRNFLFIVDQLRFYVREEISNTEEQLRLEELLYFLKEEMQEKNPRMVIVQSALHTLRTLTKETNIYKYVIKLMENFEKIK